MSDSDAAETPVPLSTYSGRYAIVAIAVLAIGGAAFNWWYHRDLHRRSLEFWSVPIAQLIVEAPEAEALRIERADERSEETDTLSIDGQTWNIVDRQRIDSPAQAPGSSHVRGSLVNDKSFDWETPADDCQPDWQYAIRFRDGEQEQVVLIALDCPRVALLGTQRRGSIRPMVPALTKFFAERFSR